MISARHWREQRRIWHALVFWVWLASFVFGFAASDLFHGPNCPEQLALRAAAHAPTTAQLSVSHAIGVDFECPTCLLQFDAQGVLAATVILAAPLIAVSVFAGLRPVHAIARAQSSVARGPPLSFI